MRNIRHRAAAWYLATIAGIGLGPLHAGDLTWEVENPFRLYQHATSFKIHADAYRLVRGAADSPMPNDIVQLVERCLNDPKSSDAPTAGPCAALARDLRAEDRRRGWAARTLDDVCYNWKTRPGRDPAKCMRQRDIGMIEEDYILPDSHAVSIGLSPQLAAEAATGLCTWHWKPRAGSGAADRHTMTLPCSDPLVIDKVPFARDRAASGVEVTVDLPTGRKISDPEVIVDDALIVALGDSFSSGESNPDRPVKFSATTPLDYRLARPSIEVAAVIKRPGRRPVPPAVRLSDGSKPDPYVLPRRE